MTARDPRSVLIAVAFYLVALAVLAALLVRVSLARTRSPLVPSSSLDRPEADPRESLLILVRLWDPKTHELIGWLPMHRAAIKFQQVAGAPQSFELNEVATVYFWRPSKEVETAPAKLTYEGRAWLPAERDANAVTIKGRTFFIRLIDFSDRWRLPRGDMNGLREENR